MARRGIRTSVRGEKRRQPRAVVRDLLMRADQHFSKAEMQVVRQLLANYPAAGLTTVSRLAQKSGVSDPTVLRVATRLGFTGFAELQAALLAEVEAHMRSPLTLPQVKGRPGATVYQAFIDSTRPLIGSVRDETPASDFERAVALLANRRFSVSFIGGRFSRFLAGLMQRSVNHMRDGTHLLDGSRADVLDEIAGFTRRNLLVVFDYRRYQTDVVAAASAAHQRGATLILFTDRWQSPIARIASVAFIAPTETTSPFDTLVTPLLQVEAVIAGLSEKLRGEWPARAALLEELRNANEITLAGGEPPPERSYLRKRNRPHVKEN